MRLYDHGVRRLLIVAFAIAASSSACDEHHDVDVELPKTGRAMTKEERRETQRIADDAFRDARAELEGLPARLTLIVRWGSDVIPETGESGTASYPGNVMWTVDPARDVGQTIRKELRPSLIHELHHLARASRLRSVTLLDQVVTEGLATAFERDVAKIEPPWAAAPPEAWTTEILALPPATEIDPWMRTHPDGRRWIGMRVGTAIVDRATRASGKSAASLVFATTDEVLRLAGALSVTAPAPSVTADPTDPLEIEAKREWEKDQARRHRLRADAAEGRRQDARGREGDRAATSSTISAAATGASSSRPRRRGAKATGIDIDPARVAEARGHVKSARRPRTASIRWANVFSVDLSPATVVTLYLLPQLNVRLIPQLEKLRPGSRIVSHDFDMAGVKPDAEYTVTASEFVKDGHSAYKGDGVPEDKGHYAERAHHIYLWTIPFHKR